MCEHWSLFLVRLVNRNSCIHLETVNVPVFAEKPCVRVGHSFSTQPGIWKFYLSLYLLLMSSSQVINLGLSPVFPEYVHSSAHVCGLLDSKEYVRAFQSPYGHCLNHLVSLLFVPTVIHLLKHCEVIIFDRYPKGTWYLHLVSSLSQFK